MLQKIKMFIEMFKGIDITYDKTLNAHIVKSKSNIIIQSDSNLVFLGDTIIMKTDKGKLHLNPPIDQLELTKKPIGEIYLKNILEE